MEMNLKDSEISTPRNTKERGRCWCLTIHHYTPAHIELLESLKPKLKKYAWQSEIAKEKGTPHLQVCLWFINQRTFGGMQRLFPKIHIEIAKNWMAAINYCKKKETADGIIKEASPEIDDKLNVATKDPMKGLKDTPWEIQIRKLIEKEPDNRTIHWYWEPKGGVGKTTFVKSLIMKNPGYIYISGKVADIKYGITKYIVDRKTAPKVIFMNIPRSVEHISYNGLEQVKDGLFYNTKYESGMVVYDNPHVIIFANEEPDYSKMSEDRWNVVLIN